MNIAPYSWITSVLVILSSSIYAANNPLGSALSASTGDFDIQLLMPPLAQIGFPIELSNIDFGDFDESLGFQEQEQLFCIFHNTPLVTLVAESRRSGVNGSFVLAHTNASNNVNPENAAGIEYQVEIFGNGEPIAVGPLIAGTPTIGFRASNAQMVDVPNCTEGSSNMELRLRLANNINFDEKDTGAYRDELTLTVNAE